MKAHISDSGRLEELLVPGREVYLARRTSHLKGTLVSVDSRVPNKLVFNTLKVGFFQGFVGYTTIIREARYGGSRLDFRLDAPSKPSLLIEVKSVTLVKDGRALFPDAPTSRGARHMRELAEAKVLGGITWRARGDTSAATRRGFTSPP